MMIELRQSVCSSFWKADGGVSVPVLMVPATLWGDCSSWKGHCGASVLIIIGTSSIKCPSTLCFSKRCCFVVVLVTSIKNGWLGRASIMPFAVRYPWLMRSESWSKCRRPFDLAVAKIFATERGPRIYCLLPQTVCECFIVELWSSFPSKWVFTFAFCVLCFSKTALAQTSCCYTMATGIDFHTVTFCTSGKMAGTCFSVKAVPRSTLMANFSTTLKSTFVSRASVLTCSVIFYLVLSRSFDWIKPTVVRF